MNKAPRRSKIGLFPRREAVAFAAERARAQELNRERRRAELAEGRKAVRAAHAEQSSSGRVPAAVLADRDRRAGLSARDTTALLLGDPLPGYSALERRA